MINHSLLFQIAIYFMMPLLLAIVHTIVEVTAANNAILEYGKINIMEQVISILFILIVIYGGYFLMTYFCARSMIRSK